MIEAPFEEEARHATRKAIKEAVVQMAHKALPGEPDAKSLAA